MKKMFSRILSITKILLLTHTQVRLFSSAVLEQWKLFLIDNLLLNSLEKEETKNINFPKLGKWFKHPTVFSLKFTM